MQYLVFARTNVKAIFTLYWVAVPLLFKNEKLDYLEQVQRLHTSNVVKGRLAERVW